jgi:hypothetical protein
MEAALTRPTATEAPSSAPSSAPSMLAPPGQTLAVILDRVSHRSLDGEVWLRRHRIAA